MNVCTVASEINYVNHDQNKKKILMFHFLNKPLYRGYL